MSRIFSHSPLAVRVTLADDLGRGVDRKVVVQGAVHADRVKALEQEPRRIHDRVAAVARRVLAVLFQALAQGARVAAHVVEVQVHVARRRRHQLAQHALQDVLAAQGRRGLGRMRVHGQKRAAHQEARARPILRQRHRHERNVARSRRRNLPNLIERRELAVHEALVRREQLADVAVPAEHEVIDQELHFSAHRRSNRRDRGWCPAPAQSSAARRRICRGARSDTGCW